MKIEPETVEVSIQELEALVDRARVELLDEQGHRKLRGAIETLGDLARRLADKQTTLAQLRDLLLTRHSRNQTGHAL